MHEDLLPAIEELEQAVEARDAHAAAAVLRRLNDEVIYSGNEVYDRLHAVAGKLGVVLFDGLEPAEFGQLLVDDKQHHVKFEVWEALEEISERVSAEFLWEMFLRNRTDYLGFPGPHMCPKLHATLEAADDEKISRQLIEAIDRLATAEAAEGSSLSAHQRAMSTFRFIRWNPDDKGLGECVRLLAARRDDRARAACQRYLIELPWGADRRATVELLEGITATASADNQAWFTAALAEHRRPAFLRTWLWRAIGETDPAECLLGAVGDLAESDNAADRITFIDFLGCTISELNSRDVAFDPGPVAAAAEQVGTTDWSRVTRGYYGTMLKAQLPRADAARVSKRLDRAAIAVARGWEAVRLDHMGCLIPLALMIGGGWLASYGLDKLLGEPAGAGWLPIMLFWGWIVWALVNVRTHFSGHETIGGQVRAGIIYFALLLGALLAAVLVRLG